MDTPTVEEINLDIEHAKGLVSKSEALKRLESNADFRRVFIEGYFKDEAIRLVDAKSMPQLQGEEAQAQIIKSIDGIGTCKEYLRTVHHVGDNAKRAIEDSEQLLEELAEEGEV